LEFTAKSADLKKALSVVSLATGDKEDTLPSHALFRLNSGGDLKMFATDGDRFAVAGCETISAEVSETNEFTADPKKLTALLNSSESDEIRFVYKDEETTLHVFASENKESYVAFGSFKPQNALPFEEELDNLQEVKSVNSEALKRGIKFTQGFMSTEENNRKYSCVYISQGVFYSSNGYNCVSAFQSPEFEGVEFIVLRGPMIPQVASATDKFDTDEVTIKTTSKFVSFWSDTGDGFGFLKSTEELPKLPISLEPPDWDSFTVSRSLLSKKLSRLAITSKATGIQAVITGNAMDLTTLDERASTETIDITRKTGDESVTVRPGFKGFRDALNQYWTEEIDIYVKSRCYICCNGEILLEAEEGSDREVISFSAASVIAMVRDT